MFKNGKKVLVKMLVRNDDASALRHAMAQTRKTCAGECEYDDEFDDELDACERECGADNGENSAAAPLELVTEGYLSKRNGRVELHYAEADQTDLANEMTTLSFEEDDPSVLMMERNGVCKTSMVFEAGRRYLCIYDVGGMVMEIIVRTYDLENTLGEQGGRIHLGYTLENGGSTFSSVKMDINIEPV